MSSQLKFNQILIVAFGLLFSLLCMPVSAQNSSTQYPTGSNQFVNLLINGAQALIGFISKNFDAIAKFFVTVIWPALLAIGKALISKIKLSNNPRSFYLYIV
ncbi:hypothetical protein CONCODRAFT_9644 [Conidiobolus coronatus NRRL 28638]|uniref:Uncharacterized protein n=1 Tax=Conidiobolus coronatus (strain ATCC 28846 / CBS 209.66 / NRRL 28638) TaxID=796925 RepID=A0A137NZY6_CONC2|nr:hypothetical protein CONCODRAFT_9644 [Conidiobolus coronatus NRRL 28638]|eukprot:KXN68169.1 hypothetical protein CONCODRAFT_9644 [Conidiobolus coronatus NRRL 28638]